MKVQRVRLPETDRFTYLVLDDEYVPIQPIFSYLTFLHDLDRSPNTIRACAHHLKLFWEFLRDERLQWTEVDVAHLAAFITCSDIDRTLIVAYIGSLQERKLSGVWRNKTLGNPRTFLETCAYRLQVSGLTKEQLIFDDDFVKQPEARSREIPEEVLEQKRIKEQAEEIRQLKKQLEVAYSSLYQRG
jgi:hypothetical protein